MKKLFKSLFLIVLLAAGIFGYSSFNSAPEQNQIVEVSVDENKEYSSRDEVALYIHLYNHLPNNYITKTKAKKLGWDQDDLWDVAPGKSIGGGPFQNLEKLLPIDKEYKECDIDYKGGDRNAKRLVYSTDGYIYYTDDHYESFILLYEPE